MGTIYWYYFINIMVFLVIILVRLLFRLRLRDWLQSLKLVGPLLKFLVSRKVRDLQSLCLILCNLAVTFSGQDLNSRRGLKSGQFEVVSVLIDVISSVLTITGLLALCCFYHFTQLGQNISQVEFFV